MAKVVWTKTALEDAKNIARFIERDSPINASTFIQNLLQNIDRLEIFPESGRVIPEFNIVSLREVIFKSHRVFYLYDGVEVQILTIIHSKMDV